LYVDLNGGRRSVLVTVGENTYATHDGALQVTYKPDSNDEKIAVTIGVGTTASPQLPPLSDAQRLGRRTR
jgi:hypothetical protein